MHILIAPDSFKGSLSAREIINIIRDEIRRCIPDCIISALPMADGGEGTMDILMDICRGSMTQVCVHGPLMEPVLSGYAILEDGTALIEMASASGLPMVPEKMRNPELTTTFGTGELIRDALDKGFRKIVIGLGGSATNDGGTGALHALGVRFLDRSGALLEGTGRNLIHIDSADVSLLHPACRETEFIIMCDIDNPLTGPNGATCVFSPQKGADRAMLIRLEQGMCRYEKVLNRMSGQDIGAAAGAGAAGGLAAGLMAFLNGRLSSGIRTVLNLSHFDDILLGMDPEDHSRNIGKVDLIITGEGRADSQSAHGKVLWGIGTEALKRQIPVIALTGCLGEGYEELYDCGICQILPNKEETMSMEYAMEHTEELLRANTRRICEELRA